MRKGAVVEVLFGNYAGRIGIVEQWWPADNRGITCEVYIPGATQDGGSIINLHESNVRRIGRIDLRPAKVGKYWTFIPKSSAGLTRSGTVAADVTKESAAAIRRRALWHYVAGRQA